MRPRHYTAENRFGRAPRDSRRSRFNEAAALHRGKLGSSRETPPRRCCFNEAAALHRGKRFVRLRSGIGGLASMRPRHYTAENAQARSRRGTSCSRFNEAAALHRGKLACRLACFRSFNCFNEAAALHRGKRRNWVINEGAMKGFNEAAALHRGKLRINERASDGRMASMRPRHYTAENGRHICCSRRRNRCFNEAAALHRGKHA